MTSYRCEVRGRRARVVQQEAGAVCLWQYHDNDTVRSVQVLGLAYILVHVVGRARNCNTTSHLDQLKDSPVWPGWFCSALAQPQPHKYLATYYIITLEYLNRLYLNYANMSPLFPFACW